MRRKRKVVTISSENVQLTRKSEYREGQGRIEQASLKNANSDDG